MVSADGLDECDPEMIGFELVTGYVFSAPTDLLDSLPGTLMLTDCLESCQANDSCQAVNYETGLCVLFSSNADTYPGKPRQVDAKWNVQKHVQGQAPPSEAVSRLRILIKTHVSYIVFSKPVYHESSSKRSDVAFRKLIYLAASPQNAANIIMAILLFITKDSPASKQNIPAKNIEETFQGIFILKTIPREIGVMAADWLQRIRETSTPPRAGQEESKEPNESGTIYTVNDASRFNVPAEVSYLPQRVISLT